ncbi:MAG: hypothetical protein P857_20 [Candidatus Xenolissoclinum pacificiensis L6]|uniref:Uncharacterized protein n=1 Tax=Candidatus Xenolissoclinum pacificiensis L6 TaxID=1401685 RepID=W2V291_9RICK|nr:MAG: hypothetical protein P857_20 [Candidatus Xenolissoclinum pacificiensis L6]
MPFSAMTVVPVIVKISALIISFLFPPVIVNFNELPNASKNLEVTLL